MQNKDVCVFDFCGYSEPGHFPVSMWADWDGEKTMFGGEWQGIPEMTGRAEPSEEEVVQWVKERQGKKEEQNEADA